jgi:hypothetical protein
MDLLADEAQPLIISERCTGLIAALASVKPHRGRPEVYDFEHQLFSHPLDALRYLLLNVGTEAVFHGCSIAGRKPSGGYRGRRF